MDICETVELLQMLLKDKDFKVWLAADSMIQAGQMGMISDESESLILTLSSVFFILALLFNLLS